MAQDNESFFKKLSSEMSGGLKELALVLIDFRREFKSKIHPNITDIATKYIPEAADQLEGVIETTEAAANKLMDNLENMEQNIGGINKVFAFLREGKIAVPGHERVDHEFTIDKKTVKAISPLIDYIESNTEDYMSLISDSFTQMSFQDLTGQRIKRIINLVSVMEEKIKGMIISFGIKVNEREKNPDLSQDDLQRVVEKKVEELSGPQRQGQGLDQTGIDELLANF
jgi:chemotaxis protein CheZ